jgi:VWFA-related protein
MKSAGRHVIWIAATLAALAAPLLEAGRQDPLSFRSNTRLVELSVVVTDRDQNAVPGLTAGDFQIFDDGKPQKVELFSVEGSRTAAPAPPAPPRPAREISNKLPSTGSVTIILYDQLNTSEVARMNVREHVARFLEQIRPDDRVGLYVLGGDGVLRVAHDFTSDARALVRAVSRLRGNVSTALAGEQDGARLDAEIAELFGRETAAPRPAPGQMGESPGTAMQRHFQGVRAVATVDALESIGHHLSGVQNRKNLIWVSSGFPLEAFGYRGRSKVREINRATRALNDANVALYTVDARGLLPGLSGVPGNQTFTTLSMVAENQDVLQSVAEDTGGRAFLNTNEIQGSVRRAADDARMTYVLGYYPANEIWDGRFHRVEVKVNRPRVEVRHRKGYFAVASEKQAIAERAAALQAAVASPIGASGLGLTLRIDPVAGRPSAYRLMVRVEPDGIALERRGGESRGALDVIVAQIRADGADARSFDDRVDISLSGERLRLFLRDGLRIEHTVTLMPVAERLRIVVRDARTGAIGAIGVSRQQFEAIVPPM